MESCKIIYYSSDQDIHKHLSAWTRAYENIAAAYLTLAATLKRECIRIDKTSKLTYGKGENINRALNDVSSVFISCLKNMALHIENEWKGYDYARSPWHLLSKLDNKFEVNLEHQFLALMSERKHEEDALKKAEKKYLKSVDDWSLLMIKNGRFSPRSDLEDKLFEQKDVMQRTYISYRDVFDDEKQTRAKFINGMKALQKEWYQRETDIMNTWKNSSQSFVFRLRNTAPIPTRPLYEDLHHGIVQIDVKRLVDHTLADRLDVHEFPVQREHWEELIKKKKASLIKASSDSGNESEDDHHKPSRKVSKSRERRPKSGRQQSTQTPDNIPQSRTSPRMSRRDLPTKSKRPSPQPKDLPQDNVGDEHLYMYKADPVKEKSRSSKREDVYKVVGEPLACSTPKRVSRKDQPKKQSAEQSRKPPSLSPVKSILRSNQQNVIAPEELKVIEMKKDIQLNNAKDGESFVLSKPEKDVEFRLVLAFEGLPQMQTPAPTVIHHDPCCCCCHTPVPQKINIVPHKPAETGTAAGSNLDLESPEKTTDLKKSFPQSNIQEAPREKSPSKEASRGVAPQKKVLEQLGTTSSDKRENTQTLSRVQEIVREKPSEEQVDTKVPFQRKVQEVPSKRSSETPASPLDKVKEASRTASTEKQEKMKILPEKKETQISKSSDQQAKARAEKYVVMNHDEADKSDKMYSKIEVAKETLPVQFETPLQEVLPLGPVPQQDRSEALDKIRKDVKPLTANLKEGASIKQEKKPIKRYTKTASKSSTSPDSSSEDECVKENSRPARRRKLRKETKNSTQKVLKGSSESTPNNIDKRGEDSIESSSDDSKIKKFRAQILDVESDASDEDDELVAIEKNSPRNRDQRTVVKPKAIKASCSPEQVSSGTDKDVNNKLSISSDSAFELYQKNSDSSTDTLDVWVPVKDLPQLKVVPTTTFDDQSQAKSPAMERTETWTKRVDKTQIKSNTEQESETKENPSKDIKKQDFSKTEEAITVAKEELSITQPQESIQNDLSSTPVSDSYVPSESSTTTVDICMPEEDQPGLSKDRESNEENLISKDKLKERPPERKTSEKPSERETAKLDGQEKPSQIETAEKKLREKSSDRETTKSSGNYDSDPKGRSYQDKEIPIEEKKIKPSENIKLAEQAEETILRSKEKKVQEDQRASMKSDVESKNLKKTDESRSTKSKTIPEEEPTEDQEKPKILSEVERKGSTDTKASEKIPKREPKIPREVHSKDRKDIKPSSKVSEDHKVSMKCEVVSKDLKETGESSSNISEKEPIKHKDKPKVLPKDHSKDRNDTKPSEKINLAEQEKERKTKNKEKETIEEKTAESSRKTHLDEKIPTKSLDKKISKSPKTLKTEPGTENKKDLHSNASKQEIPKSKGPRNNDPYQPRASYVPRESSTTTPSCGHYDSAVDKIKDKSSLKPQKKDIPIEEDTDKKQQEKVNWTDRAKEMLFRNKEKKSQDDPKASRSSSKDEVVSKDSKKSDESLSKEQKKASDKETSKSQKKSKIPAEDHGKEDNDKKASMNIKLSEEEEQRMKSDSEPRLQELNEKPSKSSSNNEDVSKDSTEKSNWFERAKQMRIKNQEKKAEKKALKKSNKNKGFFKGLKESIFNRSSKNEDSDSDLSDDSDSDGPGDSDPEDGEDKGESLKQEPEVFQPPLKTGIDTDKMFKLLAQMEKEDKLRKKQFRKELREIGAVELSPSSSSEAEECSKKDEEPESEEVPMIYYGQKITINLVEMAKKREERIKEQERLQEEKFKEEKERIRQAVLQNWSSSSDSDPDLVAEKKFPLDGNTFVNGLKKSAPKPKINLVELAKQKAEEKKRKEEESQKEKEKLRQAAVEDWSTSSDSDIKELLEKKRLEPGTGKDLSQETGKETSPPQKLNLVELAKQKAEEKQKKEEELKEAEEKKQKEVLSDWDSDEDVSFKEKKQSDSKTNLVDLHKGKSQNDDKSTSQTDKQATEKPKVMSILDELRIAREEEAKEEAMREAQEKEELAKSLEEGDPKDIPAASESKEKEPEKASERSDNPGLSWVREQLRRRREGRTDDDDYEDNVVEDKEKENAEADNIKGESVEGRGILPGTTKVGDDGQKKKVPSILDILKGNVDEADNENSWDDDSDEKDDGKLPVLDEKQNKAPSDLGPKTTVESKKDSPKPKELMKSSSLDELLDKAISDNSWDSDSNEKEDGKSSKIPSATGTEKKPQSDLETKTTTQSKKSKESLKSSSLDDLLDAIGFSSESEKGDEKNSWDSDATDKEDGIHPKEKKCKSDVETNKADQSKKDSSKTCKESLENMSLDELLDNAISDDSWGKDSSEKQDGNQCKQNKAQVDLNKKKNISSKNDSSKSKESLKSSSLDELLDSIDFSSETDKEDEKDSKNQKMMDKSAKSKDKLKSYSIPQKSKNTAVKEQTLKVEVEKDKSETSKMMSSSFTSQNDGDLLENSTTHKNGIKTIGKNITPEKKCSEDDLFNDINDILSDDLPKISRTSKKEKIHAENDNEATDNNVIQSIDETEKKSSQVDKEDDLLNDINDILSDDLPKKSRTPKKEKVHVEDEIEALLETTATYEVTDNNDINDILSDDLPKKSGPSKKVEEQVHVEDEIEALLAATATYEVTDNNVIQSIEGTEKKSSHIDEEDDLLNDINDILTDDLPKKSSPSKKVQEKVHVEDEVEALLAATETYEVTDNNVSKSTDETEKKSSQVDKEEDLLNEINDIHSDDLQKLSRTSNKVQEKVHVEDEIEAFLATTPTYEVVAEDTKVVEEVKSILKSGSSSRRNTNPSSPENKLSRSVSFNSKVEVKEIENRLTCLLMENQYSDSDSSDTDAIIISTDEEMEEMNDYYDKMISVAENQEHIDNAANEIGEVVTRPVTPFQAKNKSDEMNETIEDEKRVVVQDLVTPQESQKQAGGAEVSINEEFLAQEKQKDIASVNESQTQVIKEPESFINVQGKDFSEKSEEMQNDLPSTNEYEMEKELIGDSKSPRDNTESSAHSEGLDSKNNEPLPAVEAEEPIKEKEEEEEEEEVLYDSRHQDEGQNKPIVDQFGTLRDRAKSDLEENHCSDQDSDSLVQIEKYLSERDMIYDELSPEEKAQHHLDYDLLVYEGMRRKREKNKALFELARQRAEEEEEAAAAAPSPKEQAVEEATYEYEESPEEDFMVAKPAESFKYNPADFERVSTQRKSNYDDDFQQHSYQTSSSDNSSSEQDGGWRKDIEVSNKSLTPQLNTETKPLPQLEKVDLSKSCSRGEGHAQAVETMAEILKAQGCSKPLGAINPQSGLSMRSSLDVRADSPTDSLGKLKPLKPLIKGLGSKPSLPSIGSKPEDADMWQQKTEETSKSFWPSVSAQRSDQHLGDLSPHKSAPSVLRLKNEDASESMYDSTSLESPKSSVLSRTSLDNAPFQQKVLPGFSPLKKRNQLDPIDLNEMKNKEKKEKAKEKKKKKKEITKVETAAKQVAQIPPMTMRPSVEEVNDHLSSISKGFYGNDGPGLPSSYADSQELPAGMPVASPISRSVSQQAFSNFARQNSQWPDGMPAASPTPRGLSSRQDNQLIAHRHSASAIADPVSPRKLLNRRQQQDSPQPTLRPNPELFGRTSIEQENPVVEEYFHDPFGTPTQITPRVMGQTKMPSIASSNSLVNSPCNSREPSPEKKAKNSDPRKFAGIMDKYIQEKKELAKLPEARRYNMMQNAPELPDVPKPISPINKPVMVDPRKIDFSEKTEYVYEDVPQETMVYHPDFVDEYGNPVPVVHVKQPDLRKPSRPESLLGRRKQKNDAQSSGLLRRGQMGEEQKPKQPEIKNRVIFQEEQPEMMEMPGVMVNPMTGEPMMVHPGFEHEGFIPPEYLEQFPEGFDPRMLPPGFDPQLIPDGFDPRQLLPGFHPQMLPEGFNPEQLPPGYQYQELPEGFDPHQLPPGYQIVIDPENLPPGVHPDQLQYVYEDDNDPRQLPPGFFESGQFDPRLLPPGVTPEEFFNSYGMLPPQVMYEEPEEYNFIPPEVMDHCYPGMQLDEHHVLGPNYQPMTREAFEAFEEEERQFLAAKSAEFKKQTKLRKEAEKKQKKEEEKRKKKEAKMSKTPDPRAATVSAPDVNNRPQSSRNWKEATAPPIKASSDQRFTNLMDKLVSTVDKVNKSGFLSRNPAEEVKPVMSELPGFTQEQVENMSPEKRGLWGAINKTLDDRFGPLSPSSESKQMTSGGLRQKSSSGLSQLSEIHKPLGTELPPSLDLTPEQVENLSPEKRKMWDSANKILDETFGPLTPQLDRLPMKSNWEPPKATAKMSSPKIDPPSANWQPPTLKIHCSRIDPPSANWQPPSGAFGSPKSNKSEMDSQNQDEKRKISSPTSSSRYLKSQKAVDKVLSFGQDEAAEQDASSKNVQNRIVVEKVLSVWTPEEPAEPSKYLKTKTDSPSRFLKSKPAVYTSPSVEEPEEMTIEASSSRFLKKKPEENKTSSSDKPAESADTVKKPVQRKHQPLSTVQSTPAPISHGRMGERLLNRKSNRPEASTPKVVPPKASSSTPARPSTADVKPSTSAPARRESEKQSKQDDEAARRKVDDSPVKVEASSRRKAESGVKEESSRRRSKESRSKEEKKHKVEDREKREERKHRKKKTSRKKPSNNEYDEGGNTSDDSYPSLNDPIYQM